MKRLFPAASAMLAPLMLSGCITLQNFTATDLRKPEYAYREVQIGKTIPQIHEALFEYESNCRDLGGIKLDPSGARQIVITQTAMGLTKPSVYALVDIDANDSGATLKSYTYYNNWAWHGHVDEIIRAIKDPKTCV